MNRDGVMFLGIGAACIIAIAALILAYNLFGGAATCSRACGGHMAKWQPTAATSVEVCECEVKP
jgi:hypothetical protein